MQCNADSKCLLFPIETRQSRGLGSIYTKRQRQRHDNSGMMLAILFSLKTMETLENGLQPHSGASS